MSMLEFLADYSTIVVFFGLLLIGYGAGSIAERRHFASLLRREKMLENINVSTAEGDCFCTDHAGELVTGSVVISIDYFKRMLALIRNIFGGRVSSYESLIERARREAILRMKEHAAGKGYTIIINVRMETAAIGKRANQKHQIGSVEAISYGTALSGPSVLSESPERTTF